MRTPLALALVLAACNSADRRDDAAVHDASSAAPSAATSKGPDPVVLRVPRGGGVARAYVYPDLDSVVWRSTGRLPALARVLAFDQDLGLVAFVDEKGLPGRLDLRLGGVVGASKTRFASLASADGSGIFGVANGTVTRLTPTDARPWRFTPPAGAREVFPEPDGSVLVAAARPNGTVVWRLRPPDTTLVDTVMLPPTEHGVRTAVGDRVYFTAEGGLIGLRSRDFAPTPPINFDSPVRAVAPTPSGDRVYVTTDSGRGISVIDRYTDAVGSTIALGGGVTDLRMDPLGRYVLARAARGDSAWVVAVGTGRVIGSVPTAWRSDLPLVTPDGLVALVTGDDVTLVDGETLRPRRTVKGGAKDFWHLIFWSGFRPRAAGIDEPVTFGTGGSDSATDPVDSALAARDTTAVAATTPPPVDSTRRGGENGPPPPRATAAGFTVQFAAVRTEEAARAAAAPIQVGGQSARVITSETEGLMIYRVVLGPYPSRQEAERVGRSSGRDFWVYEGIP